jgi:hypothetical protein
MRLRTRRHTRQRHRTFGAATCRRFNSCLPCILPVLSSLMPACPVFSTLARLRTPSRPNRPLKASYEARAYGRVSVWAKAALFHHTMYWSRRSNIVYITIHYTGLDAVTWSTNSIHSHNTVQRSIQCFTQRAYTPSTMMLCTVQSILHHTQSARTPFSVPK